MKILLLDMDDVLVEPGGYHQALEETVIRVGEALGYRRVTFSGQDILAFESAGVYSEWDTAAICEAVMLEKAWEAGGRPHLPEDLRQNNPISLDFEGVSFQEFAGLMRQDNLPGLRPLERAERILLERMDGRVVAENEQIRRILHTARSAEGSLTHRIFQELVLGSQEYAQAYHLPGLLDTESYLLRYDRPLITPELVAELSHWQKQPAQRAAVFTSRPSQPLPGVFSVPEAELGSKLVCLEGIPIVGLGGLLWLSRQRAAGPQSFTKPSPVHSLSAMLLSQGLPLQECLSAAGDLTLDKKAVPAWDTLQGARVAVFEDSTAGMQSALQARELLASAGISIQLELYGISDQPIKADALVELGAKPFNTINLALQQEFLP